MILDYNQQLQFTESIDLVDAGNTALQCNTDGPEEYYVLVRTVLGTTKILKFGPVMPDLGTLLNGFGCVHKEFDYNENKIKKELLGFINNPTAGITSVTEILPEEAIKFFPVASNFLEDN